MLNNFGVRPANTCVSHNVDLHQYTIFIVLALTTQERGRSNIPCLSRYDILSKSGERNEAPQVYLTLSRRDFVATRRTCTKSNGRKTGRQRSGGPGRDTARHSDGGARQCSAFRAAR